MHQDSKNKIAWLAGAALLALSGCVDISRWGNKFPCGSGGACPSDAGLLAPDTASDEADGSNPDASIRDASIRDASIRDAGDRTACQALPFSMLGSGVVEGDTTRGERNFVALCGQGEDSPQVWYALEVPVALETLELEFVTADFDAVLAVYDSPCASTPELGCASRGANSHVVLRDLPAGTYAVLVEGATATDVGAFTLRARGAIAAALACTSEQPFFACTTGVCARDLGVDRCVAPRDCADGFDNDDDGAVDEDAASCLSPPVVTCPESMRMPAGPETTLPLVGRASDDTGIAGGLWRVRSTPWTGLRDPLTISTTEVRTDLPIVGDYVFRYTALDASAQGSSCELNVAATPGAELAVELLWSEELADLDLHVLSPRATSWADAPEVCYYTCPADRPDWGVRGQDQNPLHSGDRLFGPALEAIRIVDAEDSAIGYRIGVAAAQVDGAARATLRVSCGGRTETFGPVSFGPDPTTDAATGMWKAVDVVFDGATCVITPLDAAGRPLIVSFEASAAAR